MCQDSLVKCKKASTGEKNKMNDVLLQTGPFIDTIFRKTRPMEMKRVYDITEITLLAAHTAQTPKTQL